MKRSEEDTINQGSHRITTELSFKNHNWTVKNCSWTVSLLGHLILGHHTFLTSSLIVCVLTLLFRFYCGHINSTLTLISFLRLSIWFSQCCSFCLQLNNVTVTIVTRHSQNVFRSGCILWRYLIASRQRIIKLFRCIIVAMSYSVSSQLFVFLVSFDEKWKRQLYLASVAGVRRGGNEERRAPLLRPATESFIWRTLSLNNWWEYRRQRLFVKHF